MRRVGSEGIVFVVEILNESQLVSNPIILRLSLWMAASIRSKVNFLDDFGRMCFNAVIGVKLASVRHGRRRQQTKRVRLHEEKVFAGLFSKW